RGKSGRRSPHAGRREDCAGRWILGADASLRNGTASPHLCRIGQLDPYGKTLIAQSGMGKRDQIFMRAMVMAAGAGTRLHPLTASVPKPMVPVANRPVLEYTLENLARHGITELTLNLHSFPDLMRSHFKSGEKWGVRIQYSHEPKLLGTAGGVKKAESFF